MILTDSQIKEAIDQGGITIKPFEQKQLQPASYDLRVGPQGVTTSGKELIDLQEKGYMSMEPGDFALVTCLEEIELGAQYAARFGLRSGYARQGLVATTGPQVDPGYHGRLIIGLTNLSPKAITLPYGDDFISIEFHRLERPASHPYDGPYQGKLSLGPSEIKFITESEGMALSEVLTTLRTLAQNVGALTTQFTTLGSQFKNFQWVVGALVAFLTLFMTAITLVIALKH